MFWRTCPYLLEVHGRRGNMMWVLEFAWTHLLREGGRERRGGANGRENFRRLPSGPTQPQGASASRLLPSGTRHHDKNPTFLNILKYEPPLSWLLLGATCRYYIFSNQSLDIFTASQNLHLCSSLNQQPMCQPRLCVLQDPCKSAAACRLQGPPHLTSCSKQ